MKKFFVLLVVIIGIIISINKSFSIECDEENQTPCPEGLDGPYCFIMNYIDPVTQQQCDVAIYYCLLINGTNITTSLHHWEVGSVGCVPIIAISNQDFLGKMFSAIIEDVYDNHTQLFPPCGTSSVITWTSSSVQCFKLANDPENAVSKFIPCPNSSFFCVHYYSVCFNLTTGKLDKSYLYSEPISTPDCPAYINLLSNPFIPPPGKTWNDYFETSCAYFDCIHL